MLTEAPAAPAWAANDEPIPGYRLVARLGGGGFGEVWRCDAPGGLAKAIKRVHGADAGAALNQEYGALERVKALRHPYLLGLERAEVSGPDLLMVMELADETLADRIERCRAAGQPGIPAAELFPLAREAAEALDLLATHGLQHLDVKPGNLFLVGGHLKVGDFGLVAPIGRPRPTSADALAGLTPKYVAPEILLSGVAAATDQYALALVLYEALTGRFPYPAKSARQILVLHASAAPDLSAVDPAAGAVLARALAKDPADRFPSCTEFVRRLTATPTDNPSGPRTTDTLPVLAAMTLRTAPAPAPPAVLALSEDGCASGAAPSEVTTEEIVRPLLWAVRLGASDVAAAGGGATTDLFCRFPVRAGRPVLVQKLQWFAERWRSVPVEVEGGAFEVSVAPPTGWLRRLLDRTEPVRLVVTLPTGRVAGRGEVTATALGCAGRADGRRHALATELLADLRADLADDRDLRRAARYAVDAPAMLYPVTPAGGVGAGVEARCADRSLTGARLVSGSDLAGAERLYLRFPNHPAAARCGILCTIARRAARGPKEFEFGCRFAGA